MEKIPLIAVCGPTASGKTSLSVELAKILDAEVVSCDSMQIYRRMSIGTAKPTEEEMQGIPHHMLDICEPEDNFSVSDYVSMADGVIADIISRGKRVILCGGTGLYLDTLLQGISLSPEIPDGIRESLEKKDSDTLWCELEKVDSESALAIHKNNRKRVIRALEIYYGTGKTKTYWDALSKETGSKYDCKIIGLDFENRDILYERIDRRVDIMFDMGLCNEVKSLNLNPETTAGQAIGYKEVTDFLEGKITEEEAKNKVKLATRHYAKRQLTWFRREKEIKWIYPDTDSDIIATALEKIK